MENSIKPAQIVEFFEKSSLDAMNIVFDMVKGKVDARNQKSSDAKAKQAKSASAAAAPKKKAAAKKSHKKKAAPAPPAPLPGTTSEAGDSSELQPATQGA